MEGFRLPRDGWEFLLPEGVAHLRDMGAVCVHRWRLLGLTPTGCRILAGERVEAELLLAPGDCSLAGFSAGTVVTYGLSPRDSITLSSLTEPVLCVQRALPLACGGVLEPRNFPCPVCRAANAPAVGGRAAAVDRLALSGLRKKGKSLDNRRKAAIIFCIFLKR